MELESWFALRTTEQLFCFLALLFKGKIQEVAVDPAAMRGVPARRAPPLHYLHEHAWRRDPATPKDSPSHRTCTSDPPKQKKITSEHARIIQHCLVEQAGETIWSQSFFMRQITNCSPDFVFRETMVKPMQIQRWEQKGFEVEPGCPRLIVPQNFVKVSEDGFSLFRLVD
jgi:hypothetical protein